MALSKWRQFALERFILAVLTTFPNHSPEWYEAVAKRIRYIAKHGSTVGLHQCQRIRRVSAANVGHLQAVLSERLGAVGWIDVVST